MSRCESWTGSPRWSGDNPMEADMMAGDFTLEKFAQNPFYQEVNRRLVALARLRPGLRVVDLGAGTGAVTRLLVEEVGGNGGAPSGKAAAEVIAVEPSESAIEVARRNLESIRGAVVGPPPPNPGDPPGRRRPLRPGRRGAAAPARPQAGGRRILLQRDPPG